ncbi:hypothetical protein ABFS82_04G154700 [Erythranthe guttata]|uniref:putative late blight resistance protein homolog R1B-16 n=1 Tax=Erythranthe guttata TaxID=4155 RepID=UPI00064DA3C8|nr:PREDICTED: putative late blight resistance protein homolog R1B-16 [Erythranthe guttata]|eukprot:XP_012856921.1 PREDICTED: putative late blight resistance protein homolog R1B-16 [Erythranthe guttata]
MAAYASLVSLLTTMDQIKNHPRFSTSVDKNQLESLGEKIGFLLEFIEKHTDGVLESRIACAAYAAEDVIESHVVDQIKPGIRTKVAKIIHSMRLKKTWASLLDLHSVIEEMDSIKKKVLELKDEIGSNEHDMQPTCTTTSSSTPLITTGKNTMVGFEEQLLQLLDKLTGQQSNRQVIPIVGMGGIGKTTLAKNAYEHSLIVHHFDIRTWITVSQKYNVIELLLQLLSEKNSQIDEQLLGQKLHKMLWARRYLIVIDDIWSIEAWEEVSRFFPDNNNGSRIVVTTRISNVAIYFDSPCFELSFLDEDKSWKLFCQKAFDQVGCPSELEDIGKEIIKKCKGLPLSICVIGGLLGRSNRTQKYWKNIAKDLTSILNSGEDENCLSILSLSYTYLPAHLKPCFLYMGIFPEDHKIFVSRLIKLWVAEGFIKSNLSESWEETARGYLSDLIDRNLVLNHWLGSNGRIKICKIHDLLRDLCLKLAHKDEFICVMEDTQRGIESGRRIVCNENFITAKHHESRALHTLQLAPLTRTLVTSIDGRLPKNRLLRVMSFNKGARKKYLCRHIIDQVNMRYLAYYKLTRSFPADKLSSSIDVLWNLQTIIITANIEALSQIWKMRQLRHVDIYELHLPNPPRNRGQQQSEFVLQNLQTLKTVFNFVWSEEACERLVNVRKLNIKYVSDPQRSSTEYRLYNICRLHKLESLTCCPYDVDNVLQKLTFPSSLKKLCLEGSMIRWEDLTVIGSLPNLEVLKLKNRLVKGSVWNPVEGEFLRLKFLLIQWSDLVNWNADSSHFPVLEKLVLESLKKLEEIPLDIGEIPTLGLIQVHWCSESAAISAMKIAEEQENNGNEELQVRVSFAGKYQLESFQEKMKQSADQNFTRYNFQAVAY